MEWLAQPLGLQDHGPAVASLHEVLRELGYTVQPEERTQQSFGASTYEAVGM